MKTINDLNFGIPEEIDVYTSHSAEIGIMISNYIRTVDKMNKKTFAELVGKTASDVTRWISGSHNFTILTLSLIEARTGISIIKKLTDKNIKDHLNGDVFKLETEMDLLQEIDQLKKKLSELQNKCNQITAIYERDNIWKCVKTHGHYEEIFSSKVRGVVLNNSDSKTLRYGEDDQQKLRIRSKGNDLPVTINKLVFMD